jgi:tight adherence protein C
VIVAAVVVSFIATLLLTLTLVHAVSGQGATAATRLSKIWRPPTTEKDVTFRDKQKDRAQKVLQGIGKMVPTSAGAVPRTQKLLIHAGFRRPEAPLIFRGAKVLLTASLVGWVYLSGIYVENPFILVFAAMFGFLAPDLWLGHKARKRQHRIRLGLPDALDLMVVCVDAGLGLDQAILRVSEELKLAHRELSEEFQIMNLEMRVGRSRADGLRGLSARTGVDDIQALVAMLIQTERFGTSIAQSLRVHSDNSRIRRRQRAEERAAKAPVKMVPVLVFFIFPALFMVILGPAVITLIRQLLPMMNR